jgi:long-chain fatty acid transport protein
LCIAQLAPSVGGVAAAQATCLQGNITAQNRDGRVTLAGNNWAYGFNVGALFDVSPSTRLSASYRSKVKHEIDGTAKYDKPAFGGPLAAITDSPLTTDSNAKATLNLPDSFTFGVHQKVNDKLAVMGSLSQVRWSSFKELRIKFANGAPDTVEDQQYRNVMHAALGMTYKTSEQWQVRTGLAFDKSPVRDGQRSPRVPDGDRTWLAVGGNYTMSADTTLSLAYAHLFVKKVSSNNVNTGATLRGDYTNQANIFSLQLATKF